MGSIVQTLSGQPTAPSLRDQLVAVMVSARLTLARFESVVNLELYANRNPSQSIYQFVS